MQTCKARWENNKRKLDVYIYPRHSGLQKKARYISIWPNFWQVMDVLENICTDLIALRLVLDACNNKKTQNTYFFNSIVDILDTAHFSTAHKKL